MCCVIAGRECSSDEEDEDQAGTATEVEGADEDAAQLEKDLIVQPKVGLFRLLYIIIKMQHDERAVWSSVRCSSVRGSMWGGVTV